MTPTRRTFLRSGTVVAAGGLAGCLGGSDGDTPAPTESPTTSPTNSPTAAMAEVAVTVSSHPAHGDILTDGEGRTLYLLTADPPNESVCTGDCAGAWPPLTVESEAAIESGPGVVANLGTIERDDGTLQVTADGIPLYYWVNDEDPGDATGQEVNNVWFVLRPDASPVKPTVSVREHDELGPVITDADGQTLYLFTNDEMGMSNCTGGCVDAWPPLTVEGEDDLVESVRTDVALGTTEHPEVGPMATAAGHPLYYFAQDEEPGDAKGQGLNDAWYVLDPDGNQIGGSMMTATDAATENGGGDGGTY